MKKQKSMHETSFKPEIYESLKEFNKNHPGIECMKFDTIDLQISDLIKLRNPKTYQDKVIFEREITLFYKKTNQEEYGNWVYYPWRNTLVRLLPEEEFIEVRTVRNKYKITEEEQRILQSKKIGVVGLSVGQSVAMAIAMERIAGEIVLADFDHLELSNLNRIRTGVCNLGVLKTIATAREIAEIDPYLKITCMNEGITNNNIETFFGEGENQLDLVIDECDSLDIKVRLRNYSKRKGLPVIMDTSDRGMLDVERYDQDQQYPLFHGLINQKDIEQVVNGLNCETDNFYIVQKILNPKTMSKRLKSSLNEIGKTITTWPQLASAVAHGGAAAAIAARNILLDNKIVSGRYFIDVGNIILK